jgi:hypothetical protein
MKVKTICLAATVTLLLCGPLAAGQLYYWVDEDGVKQFSNQPPVDVPIDQVKSTPEVTTSRAPSASRPPVRASSSSTAPSDTETASEEKGGPGPMERQLLKQREDLAVVHDNLTMDAQGIKAARIAVPRNPRNQFRKKNRIINKQVIEHNKKVEAYNQQVKKFNQDPIRIKYKVQELPEKDLIPYPKKGQ